MIQKGITYLGEGVYDMATTCPKAIIKSKQIKKERLDVTYPVVEGLPDKDIQDYINSVLLGITNALIVRQGYYENPRTEITGRYHVRTNDKCVLSISIENYAFSGGAHGFTILKSVTFDIKTGKIYSLEDFFAEGVDYVRFISDIIKKQVIERDIPVINEFTAISSNQDFYIENNNLVVYFQLYELAPYYLGFVTFPIPLKDISEKMNI